ncbi:MAG: metal-dependent hydrolase [archaeon]|jgi:inner membrane protein|nr:metal-dependent hydrolase [archaeon]
MIKRTHFIIALGVAFLFLPSVNHKIVFLPVLLIAALLPDIDSPDSFFGHYKILRPVQAVVKHRGVFHSMTLCFAFSLALAFIEPILALPFFLGYSSHLFADCFTQDGIMPFWPWKKTANGLIRTGGHTESIVLYVFVAVDAILFLRLFV